MEDNDEYSVSSVYVVKASEINVAEYAMWGAKNLEGPRELRYSFLR